MADDDLLPVLTAVGPRLRALRQEAGLTLAQLAEATAISVSTLSRLESGQRRPTLELLLPLARTHQVPLDELVGAPPVGDPRIDPEPFVRHGTTYVPLTRHVGGPQAYKVIMPGGAVEGPLEQQVHDGHDWVYVLSGKLRLRLGDRELVLQAGEVAEFDCRVPHAMVNAGRAPVELIALFGAQGERAHIRAEPASKAASR